MVGAAGSWPVEHVAASRPPIDPAWGGGSGQLWAGVFRIGKRQQRQAAGARLKPRLNFPICDPPARNNRCSSHIETDVCFGLQRSHGTEALFCCTYCTSGHFMAR